jgi:hypothetical protein
MDSSKTRVYRTTDQSPVDFAKTQVLRVVAGRSGRSEYVALTPLAAASKAQRMSKRELSKLQRLPPEVDELVRELNEQRARQESRFASTQKLPSLALHRRARSGRGWFFGVALSVVVVASALSATQQRHAARHARVLIGQAPALLARAAHTLTDRMSRSAAGRQPATTTLSVATLPESKRDSTLQPQPTVAHANQVRRARRAKDEPSRPAIVSQRMAADALASGDVARAAALYGALAQRDPDNRAAAEAARILKARAGRASAP